MGFTMPRRRFIEKIMAVIGLGVTGAVLSPAVTQAQTSYFGKYRGVVTDVNDPMNIGRILVG